MKKKLHDGKIPDPMKRTIGTPTLRVLLPLIVAVASVTGSPLLAQASKLKVNNEKPEKGNQSKRIHPHASPLPPHVSPPSSFTSKKH